MASGSRRGTPEASRREATRVDQVEPFDIGQFGLPRPNDVPVVGLPYLIAQKLHACTEKLTDDDGNPEDNHRVHDIPDLLLARELLSAGDRPRVVIK